MKSFLRKTFVLIAAVSWVLFPAFHAPADEPASNWPPELSRLIREGLANNQSIQSIKAEVKGLKEEIAFAGALSDPRIGIGLLNLPTDSFSFDQEPMTQKQLFVAQKIPWFGKLDLKSQQAAVKAVRQEAVLAARQLELVRNVATAYYELGFVGSSLKINSRLIGMLNQLLRVSETRYAAGKGLQQDVLQAQVELSKLLDEKITLEKKRRALEDQINALLNRESYTPIVSPASPPYPDLWVSVDRLQQRALESNPWIKVRRAEIDQAALDIELARTDYYPDMDFIVAYGQRDENQRGQDWPDFVSASVVLNVPLWHKNRQDRKLEASKSRHQAALASYQNLAKSLPHRVDALTTDIRNLQQNYRLTADALVIQAGQWARSSLAAYEVGNVEFNTMINAQIRLLRFELQAENYLFELYKKRAELEEVLGLPLVVQDAAGNDLHSQKETAS